MPLIMIDDSDLEVVEPTHHHRQSLEDDFVNPIALPVRSNSSSSQPADADGTPALVQLASWDTVNGSPEYNKVTHRSLWAKRDLRVQLPNLPLPSAITVGRYALDNAAGSCHEMQVLYSKMGAMMISARTEFEQKMDEMEKLRQRLLDTRAETIRAMKEKELAIQRWEDEVEVESERVRIEREEGLYEPRSHDSD